MINLALYLDLHLDLHLDLFRLKDYKMETTHKVNTKFDDEIDLINIFKTFFTQ